MLWRFPGDSMIKNPPASAGDVGLIPGLERCHIQRSNLAHAPQVLSLCSRAQEPQKLSPCTATAEACAPRACAPQQEKPPQ